MSDLKRKERRTKKVREISEEDAEVPVDGQSDIDRLIALANSEFKNMNEDIDRIRRLGEHTEKVRRSSLYNTQEKEAFLDSYEYHKKRMIENVTKINELITTAQDLWNQKQAKMRELYEDEVLDVTVARKWDASLKASAEQIGKLSDTFKLIQFEF
jgi:hypothetical protein